jgi:hypothetical protein
MAGSRRPALSPPPELETLLDLAQQNGFEGDQRVTALPQVDYPIRFLLHSIDPILCLSSSAV